MKIAPAKKMTRRSVLRNSTSIGLLAAGGASAFSPQPDRQKDALSIRSKAAKHGVPGSYKYSPKNVPDATLRITEFSKCLDRDLSGPDPYLPLPKAFTAYREAMDAGYGEPNAVDANKKLEAVSAHIGTQISLPPNQKPLRFTNPLGGLAFDLEGFDPPLAPMPREPAFESLETAGEMAEVYWMALLRDRSFSEFDSLTDPQNTAIDPANLTLQDAVNDLAKYTWFAGANKVLLEKGAFWRARIPPSSFRGDDHSKMEASRRSFPGVTKGAYISTFLLQGTNVKGDSTQSAAGGILSFGPQRLSQQIVVAQGGKDYLAEDPSIWKRVQGGDPTQIGITTAGGQRFLTNLRDGTSYVHFDEIYQEYLIAASILLRMVPQLGATIIRASTGAPGSATPAQSCQGAPAGVAQNGVHYERPYVAESGQSSTFLNCGNPYRYSKSQNGFATFGITHILTMLAETSTRAHKAGWFHKWQKRRLRPEEYGARVDAVKGSLSGSSQHAAYKIPAELLNSPVLNSIFSKNNSKSYLLPQAFSEGCPTHPAYPSGHATVAGASVTILKAMFNETSQIPTYRVGANNMLDELGPLALVGDELNKLASNVLFFRGFAGVHWRSDSIEGALLGERVAIELLVEQTIRAQAGARFYREIMPECSPTSGSPFFRFTTFKGETIDIVDGKIHKVRSHPGTDQETWQREPASHDYSEYIESAYPEAFV